MNFNLPGSDSTIILSAFCQTSPSVASQSGIEVVIVHFLNFSSLIPGNRQCNPEKANGSGQDNEVWAFGDEVYEILSNLLKFRAQLKPYIKEQMLAAHQKGTPVMRPLMYDFDKDPLSWEIEDQYMFGPKYMVCPGISCINFFN